MWLLSLLALIATASAQIPSLGWCPDYQRYFTVSELGTRCVTTKYESTPEGRILVSNEITNSLTGMKRVMDGHLQVIGREGEGQNAWVLTRDRLANMQIMQAAYGVLDRFKISRAFFVKTNQADCNVLPTPAADPIAKSADIDVVAKNAVPDVKKIDPVLKSGMPQEKVAVPEAMAEEKKPMQVPELIMTESAEKDKMEKLGEPIKDMKIELPEAEKEKEEKPNIEDFKLGGKCVTADYSEKDNGVIGVVNKQLSSLTGIMSEIQGEAHQVSRSDEGKLAVQFPSLPFHFSAPYWVIDTDYDNYAVVWGCNDFGVFHTRNAWILTRARNPDLPVLEKAYAVLDKNNISRAYLMRTDQKSCPDHE
ncbi:hypothetical protein MSG28_010769 [Choristoneura fumiferana]|uniref:Uncharacterized protein n=1 Tax=Choristoneura fumiferana TaxID=7141 RepID=A0ACC0KPB3_CHOFU|nr:hypothetical protein MSG28_010769 [Choristoneura fumiferana]